MPDAANFDDVDYPTYTTGQVARMLTVQQAFLRSLDAADIITPQRSPGGHRRYSRRQVTLIVRLREQLDEGHTLAAAVRITDLQDQLEQAHTEISRLRNQPRQ
ncbi:transcriptional regulator, MerR family [Stackebrandtia nassauensis DSM 44728]|uniref:Transcriptional regulator, MerR family n=1 Tax=Stackebrandtia nassauensis (strain DSM 44728 / CIP 108903 / NRRL B-16338 / NBRC 102104 / LLR-40K-21) TaxID=446470 RepID=D3PWL4_STANL|nr:transcriptional regulator, MerR family [Stackebrandtia nassauensis DSM 44728]